MPDFVEPELCKLVDRPPSGPGWGHEIKFDGYRMQLRVEGGKAALRTRKGLDWTARFPEIAADAEALPDGLLDGEIVALDAQGRRTSRACRRPFRTGRPPAWSSSCSTPCSPRATTCVPSR